MCRLFWHFEVVAERWAIHSVCRMDRSGIGPCLQPAVAYVHICCSGRGAPSVALAVLVTADLLQQKWSPQVQSLLLPLPRSFEEGGSVDQSPVQFWKIRDDSHGPWSVCSLYLVKHHTPQGRIEPGWLRAGK